MTLKLSPFAALLLLVSSVVHAESPAPAVEPALLDTLASALFQCSEQPYNHSTHTGHLVLGQLRSHCNSVVASQDRVEILHDGRSYIFLARESALSDGGDLNDLYIQYDGREDQEELMASNLLSFGDPTLSVLLYSGHNVDALPRVLDPTLDRTH
jgi:hypothetical protein